MARAGGDSKTTQQTDAPPTLDERIDRLVSELPPKRAEFVRQYLIHRNGSEAYRQVIKKQCNPNTVRTESSRLLRRPEIQEIIRLHERRLTEKTQITHEDIARRWWELATADVSDLVALHTPPCRYCYGADHQYQWRSQREYDDAVKAFVKKTTAGMDVEEAEKITAAYQEGRLLDPLFPDDIGGFGFDLRLPPNPECPECSGIGGHPIMQTADTREMTPQAKALYAGVKQTQHGMEVQTQDRAKALENLAKHLGMFREQDDADVLDPFKRLAQRMNAAAQQVPVVPDEDLPERRAATAQATTPPQQQEGGDHDDVEP